MTHAITGVVGDEITVGPTNGTAGATTNETAGEDDQLGIIYALLFDEPLLRGKQRRVKCFLHRPLDREEQKKDVHDFELEFLLREDGTFHVRQVTRYGFASLGNTDNKNPSCWTDVSILDGRLPIAGSRWWIRFVLEEGAVGQILYVFFELRPHLGETDEQGEAT
ncbi:MAG: hypothetical protein C5B53_02430 [Candidatus Melainabacteria bacterium]|nr:MAG: hypothetical protein C5B53_02430 [Candidatus Melainabacteria bacterium]